LVISVELDLLGFTCHRVELKSILSTSLFNCMYNILLSTPQKRNLKIDDTSDEIKGDQKYGTW